MDPNERLSSDEAKAIKRLVIGGVVGIFAILTLFNTFVTTASGRVGIITTFGRVTAEVQPGIHLKIPYIQSVSGMDVQIQKEQVEAEASTNDLQNITTTVALNYHLDHARVSDVFVNLTAQYKDNIIAPTLQAAVKSVTSSYTASDLVAKRPEVTQKMQDLLITKLQPRGILIDQFSIVNFAFSRAYAASVEQKNVAQQNALKAQYTLQQATLDAQANQVQQAALTPEILEQQAIAKWNGILPTFLGQGSVFNIPLSK